MPWPSLAAIAGAVPLPPRYRFAQPRSGELPALVAQVARWHPDIRVGAGSCYLRPDFYRDKVVLEGGPDRDVLVLLVKQGERTAALWSVERDPDALSLYGKMMIVAPEDRRAGIALALVQGTEPLARASAAQYIYVHATLKVRYMQDALERAGYRLLGLLPGYDRELVEPGVVKRVFGALYGKVLVGEDGLQRPQPANLTPRARALWELLFRE